MPVLVVTAPPLRDAAAEARVLAELAGAVAAQLDLPPDGVVATLVHAARTTDGGGAPLTWPVLVLHGSPRAARALAAAATAASRVLASAWDVPADRVWTQWCTSPGPQAERP